MRARIEILAVTGLPEVEAGVALGELIAHALTRERERIEPADVVVVSQKAVSKAEGRLRDLAAVEVAAEARRLAADLGKDPRLVQLVLDESSRVLRAERGVLIVETRSGWICANAGIDTSNVPGADLVTLLPEDADASARRMRDEIDAAAGVRPAVVVADSFGRPWRLGQVDVAIGCAGLDPVDDWRGRPDRAGRDLEATEIAVPDQVAAAADLARDKGSGEPACLVRGLGRLVTGEDGPGAAALRRRPAEDLFR